jgi:hypothetical protein
MVRPQDNSKKLQSKANGQEMNINKNKKSQKVFLNVLPLPHDLK